MRRIVTALSAAVLLATATPALAHDTGLAINPDETTAIELMTDNVTLVAHHWFPDGTDMQFQRREGKQTLDGEVIDETRDFLFAGGDAKSGPDVGGVHVFDITNPELPIHLADIECRGYHADIAVYENLMFQAIDSGNSNSGCTEEAQRIYDPHEISQTGLGIRVFDITDPANPEVVAFLNAASGIGTGGSHNITVVPWAGLLYLADAGFTPTGNFTIVDIKDPTFPVTTIPMQTVAPGTADICHDIGLDPVRELAYCAAIGSTHILDISDPLKPTLVTTLRSDSMSIHHSARLAADGTTLVLGDEFAGAADEVDDPGEPFGNDAGFGSNGCQGLPGLGSLFFYDISVSIEAPLNLGVYAPTYAQPTASPCTSHFYGSVPDSTMVAAGWYEAGIVVADFSQPWPLNEYAVFLPELGNFWSAYYWHGYIYGNSREVESKGYGGGLWIIKVDGIDDDREPAPADEGTVWARWTSQLDGAAPVAAPAPTAAPAPEPQPEAAPAAEELPATGGGYAVLSVLLGGAYMMLRRRDGGASA